MSTRITQADALFMAGARQRVDSVDSAVHVLRNRVTIDTIDASIVATTHRLFFVCFRRFTALLKST